MKLLDTSRTLRSVKNGDELRRKNLFLSRHVLGFSLGKRLFKKFKGSDSAVKRRAGFVLFATALSNVFNLLYNAFLGRSVSLEDFALISLIGGILSITDIPVGALGKAVVYKSAYHFGKYNKPATAFWQYLRKRAIVASIIVSLLWVLASVGITHFFHIGSIWPVLLITPIWATTLLSSVDGGYLNGNLKFVFLACIALVESVIKLTIAFLLVKAGYDEFAYLSIVLSSAVSFILIVAAAARIKKPSIIRIQKNALAFPFKFYFSSAITKISNVVYLSSDVILAKHFLAPSQAGEYALLSLSGKMVFFAGSLFAQFILPIVSHKEGSGKNSHKVFYQLLLASFASSFLAFLMVGALGHFTMPFIFGKKTAAIIGLLPLYSLAMVAFTVATNIVSFDQIKGKHVLPVVSFLLAIGEIVGILMFHDSLKSISSVMVVMGLLSFGVIGLLHILEPFYTTIFTNLRDFFDVFLPYDTQKATNGLRILVLNWRDTKHKWAGGAEVYVQELAKRWVNEGNSVTIFCGNDRKNSRNETIDGVNIVRRGGFYTVYLWAALYYALRFRRDFDVIVDSENGIPFMSPLFSTKPVVLLIHHVHQEVFVTNMKFPLSYIGKFIEGKLMPFVYRNKTVITVSESSKKEIIKAGIAKEENIQIVNPGIEIATGRIRKSSVPQLIYLGRLKAYKNVDVAIRAFSLVLSKVKKAKFLIVGEGEAIRDLQDIVIKMELTDKVSFLGKVTEQEKIKHLSESWVAVQPSDVEGWGITVLEANACKTPVVASKTNGLKDSIIDGKTGLLIPVKDTKGFANSITKLMRNEKLRASYSKNAYTWAKNFSWDETSRMFFNVLSYEVTNKQRIFSIERLGYLMSRVTSLF